MQNSTGFSPQTILEIRDTAITTASSLTQRANAISGHVETIDRLLVQQLSSFSLDVMLALVATARALNAILKSEVSE